MHLSRQIRLGFYLILGIVASSCSQKFSLDGNGGMPIGGVQEPPPSWYGQPFFFIDGMWVRPPSGSIAIAQDVTFVKRPTNWTDSQSIDAFDSTKGELVGVEFWLLENFDFNYTGTNTGTTFFQANINLMQLLNFSSPSFTDLSPGALDLSRTYDFPVSNVTASYPINSTKLAALSIVDPAQLNLYKGSGKIAISATANASVSISYVGNNSIASSVSGFADARVRVIYYYLPK